MKVTILSAFTPTPENRSGISALLYSLVCFRPQSVQIRLLSLNMNQIDEEERKRISQVLGTPIECFDIPRRWYRYISEVWVTRFDKFFRKESCSKSLISKELLKVVLNDESDMLLLYPYFISPLASVLPASKKIIISGPDSEMLNRSRRLSNPYRLSRFRYMLDDFMFLRRFRNDEQKWGKDNIRVHFVGMADYRFYCDITHSKNAHFLLHPYVTCKDKCISFQKPKLKVIIPGAYDMYYNSDIDKMIPSLIRHKEQLLSNYEFTFLGKKWNPVEQQLRNAGFECTFKTWVDDYAEELIQHDIQITPISFGTGTKGKVLDAAVNGLLVIGSYYALENVSVRHMESCVRYKDASDIASILLSVAKQRERYQNIAEKGREQVRKYHDPVRISHRFFDLFYRDFKH